MTEQSQPPFVGYAASQGPRNIARATSDSRTPIRDNPALGALYILGGVLLAAGIITAIIGTVIYNGQLQAFNPSLETASTAMATITAGFGIGGLGALALVGGMIAHAINWQIKETLQS